MRYGSWNRNADGNWVITPPDKGKVYDCFMFNNELDLLEIRLNELDSVVDYFVLVEGTKTFGLKDKPLYYDENKERFKRFQDRIIHVVVDDLDQYKDSDFWPREWHSRESIKRGLQNCNYNDVIIISDVDEIPSKEAVYSYLISFGLCCLEQNMYYYYFNCKMRNKWNKAKILSYDLLQSMQSLEHIRQTESCAKILNGGWHYSFIGNADDVIKKMSSSSHQEFNTDKYMNRDKIEQAIFSGKDFLDREDFVFDRVDIKDSCPSFVLENIDRYIYLGYIYDDSNPYLFDIDRWNLMNNWERVVYGPEDKLGLAERARYLFAQDNVVGNKILEIGCSSGYGLRFFSKIEGLNYLGLDYDLPVIEFARHHYGHLGRFERMDIHEFQFVDHYDTIVCFETLEHLRDGKEIAQKFKLYCDCLILTVPYREQMGVLGPHHVLHNLTEKDFPGFEYKYILLNGRIIDQLSSDRAESLLMIWRR